MNYFPNSRRDHRLSAQTGIDVDVRSYTIFILPNLTLRTWFLVSSFPVTARRGRGEALTFVQCASIVLGGLEKAYTVSCLTILALI